MKIAFCSHRHITTEGCQWSHSMSEITENILDLIFYVRQTHTVVIVGLVKYLSWLPIVHRLRPKAYCLALKAFWNMVLSSIFSRSNFSECRRCLSQCQVLGIQLWARPTPSLLTRSLHSNQEDRQITHGYQMKEIITDCNGLWNKKIKVSENNWEESGMGKRKRSILENSVFLPSSRKSMCKGSEEGMRQRVTDRTWGLRGQQTPVQKASLWITQVWTLAQGPREMT